MARQPKDAGAPPVLPPVEETTSHAANDETSKDGAPEPEKSPEPEAEKPSGPEAEKSTSEEPELITHEEDEAFQEASVINHEASVDHSDICSTCGDDTSAVCAKCWKTKFPLASVRKKDGLFVKGDTGFVRVSTFVD